LTNSQVPELQTAVWQLLVGCGQSPAVLQPTHWPVELQTIPSPQAVPVAALVCVGTPSAQVSTVQGLPSVAGVSVSSATNPQVPD
jgi:hypothetical protein